MVLPPPIPPTNPDDRPHLDADDPAMQDLRAHAQFPELPPATDEHLRGAMASLLAKQQPNLQGEQNQHSASASKPVPAPRSVVSVMLPYIGVAAILLLLIAIIAPAVMSVQGQSKMIETLGHQKHAANETDDVNEDNLTAPSDLAQSGGDSNGWGSNLRTITLTSVPTDQIAPPPPPDVSDVPSSADQSPTRTTVQLESINGILQNVRSEKVADSGLTDNQNQGVREILTTPTGSNLKPSSPEPVNPNWQRDSLIPNTARLKIGDGPRDELKLTGLQANIRVDGFRARVLIDLYFYNDRDQQLQGTFNLRLPDGAAPYYLAFGETAFKAVDGVELAPDAPRLFSHDDAMNISFRPDRILKDRADSWLAPKEARMVPREKAAFAYRETVYRRKVDPALMEWTGAGVFSARVFPLMPKKLHRIVIGYDVDLQRKGNQLAYIFTLPKNVPNVAVDLSVATPRASAGGVEDADPEHAFTMQVAPAAQAFNANNYAYFRYDNPQAEFIGVLLQQGPAVANNPVLAADGSNTPGRTALVLTGAEAKADGDGTYFAAQFVPPLPLPAVGPGRPDAVFLVDTSLSMNPAKFNVYRQLLKTLLERNRAPADATDAATRNAGIHRFKVLFFNVRTHDWRADWTENTAENVAALLTDIDQIVLEGASDLHTALAAGYTAADEGFNYTQPSGPVPGFFRRSDVAMYLLSDGAATWGDSQLLATDATDLPIFAYLTGSVGNDRNALQNLANATHGAVFSVPDEKTLAAATDRLAQAHRVTPWQIQSITVEGGSDLMLAGNPTTLYPGQPLTLVGRGEPAATATIQLTVNQADGVATGESRTLTIPITARIVSDLAIRTYGQTAVERIERRLASSSSTATAATASFAEAYGCHFRVTGQSCSLLMLDSDADYQRYNIDNNKHAFEIRATPVSSIAPTDAAAALPTAKSAFLEQLTKLEKTPGVTFTASPALTTALQALPESAFDVPLEPLSPRDAGRLKLPAAYLSALATGEPERQFLLTEQQRRADAGDSAGALIAASGTVELNPGDGVLLRDTAYACLELGYPAHAYYLLRRAALQRPFEADTYLTMAQCLADSGHIDLAMAYYEIALNGQWDSRFGEYRAIASIEYLELLNRVAAHSLTTAMPTFATARRAELLRNAVHQTFDIAVVIQWNTDGTDVDLHVTEPSGEECFYQHSKTRSGGGITHDVTQGYGPEMYTLPHAPAGNYKLQVHYFAQDRSRLSVTTSVYITVIRDFGSAHPQIQHRVVHLQDNKELHDLMTLTCK